MEYNIYKIGFMQWEAEVPHGKIIYYFTAYTKWGATRLAKHYIKENKDA